MADEAPKSETPPQDAEQASVEAAIKSKAHGDTESSCNVVNGDTSSLNGDIQKSLDFADELMEKGSIASKEGDYTEAAECYSRALEIRAAQYGELAPECVNAYYKYGCALLYKAQEEADPLGTVPKKEGESKQVFGEDGSIKNPVGGESSAASASGNADAHGCSNHQKEALSDVSGGKDQEEDEECDDEDMAEADDDESDLDLAWKMLDVARAIVEKQSDDTMEKVNILSALAEVALEREDIDTSLSDYLKALAILERLVEPDSRHIAELNFRICLCLEIGSKAQEAIPYCQKAISVCKSRVQRLMCELKSFPESITTSATSELDQTAELSPSGPSINDSTAAKEAEIETLSGLSGELEKKLEDLQQLFSNPTSILSDILGMMAAKAGHTDKNAPALVTSSSQVGVASSSGDLNSPSVSTAQANGAAAGVTHLGVFGRGVKRLSTTSAVAESCPVKKPALDPTPDEGDGKAT